MTKKQAHDAEKQALHGQEPQSDPSQWPTRAEAAKAVRVSLSTITRMQQRKTLHPKLVDEVWRFDPEELAEHVALDDDTSEVSAAAVITASASLLKQAQDFARASAEHVVAILAEARKDRELSEHTTLDLVARMTETSKTDAERVKALQAQVDTLVEEARKRAQEDHEARLEELRVVRSEDRKDRGLAMVGPYVAPLVADLGRSLGLTSIEPKAPPSTGEQGDAKPTSTSSDEIPPVALVLSLDADTARKLLESKRFAIADLQEFASIREELEKKPSGDELDTLAMRAVLVVGKLTDEQQAECFSHFTKRQKALFRLTQALALQVAS